MAAKKKEIRKVAPPAVGRPASGSSTSTSPQKTKQTQVIGDRPPRPRNWWPLGTSEGDR